MLIRTNRSGIEDLIQSDEVAGELGLIAKRFSQKVRAPSSQTVGIRAGVGPQGAFSQVIMRGPGAIAIEFGSRNNAPMAPLRKALR